MKKGKAKQLDGLKVAIALFGYVDEKSKRTARFLCEEGAQVTIVANTLNRQDHSGEPFSVLYVNYKKWQGSQIAWRPLRIAVNISNNVYRKKHAQFHSARTGILEPHFGAFQMYYKLISLRPDVVCAINADMIEPVALAARKMNIPFVYEAYEFWPDYARGAYLGRNQVERNYLLRAEKTYIKQAAKFATVSPYLAREYASEYSLKEEPHVVLNAPLSKVEEVSEVHKPLRVLFLGNINKERNVQLILDAAKFMPNVVVTMQGRGTYKEEIRRQIELLGLEEKVFLKDPVPHEDLLMSASVHDIGGVFHIASDRQLEGALPNKFFEYLASGLGVIATDTITFKEFPAMQEFGVLYNVELPAEKLAEVLEGLASKPELVKEMKVAALREAEKYVGENRKESVISIYREFAK